MLTRRDLLRGRAPLRAQADRPTIAPRSAWADRDPVGPLEVEAPGDVRFLLVHHSVHSNTYGAGDVPSILRSTFGFHTGPDKGWPDVAYNFFVDRFGGIWEGRAGSLDAPVRGDATGGSQGFALLCCLLGDHRTEPPSPEARESLTALLAHLADRYGIPVGAGATATFTSRGSNLHPAGATVTTPTIAGHRDMSATECPGDAAYALVTGGLAADVAGRLAAVPPPTTAPPTTPPETTAPPTSEATTTTSTTTAPPTTTTEAATTSPGTSAPGDRAQAAPPARPTSRGSDGSWWWPAGGAVAGTLTLVGAAVGGAIALRRRTTPPR